MSTEYGDINISIGINHRKAEIRRMRHEIKELRKAAKRMKSLKRRAMLAQNNRSKRGEVAYNRVRREARELDRELFENGMPLIGLGVFPEHWNIR